MGPEQSSNAGAPPSPEDPATTMRSLRAMVHSGSKHTTGASGRRAYRAGRRGYGTQAAPPAAPPEGGQPRPSARAQLQQKLAAEQARSAELVKQLQKLKTVAQDHTDNLRKRLDAERSERMKLQDKLGLPHEEPLGEGDQWGFSNPMVAQGEP